MSQKGLTPILIVLIISFTIGGLLYYQSNKASNNVTRQTIKPFSENPSGWKLYSKDNFSFQYPSDWKLNEEKKNISLQDFPFDQIVSVESSEIELDTKTQLSLYSFSVLVRDNREKLTLDQVIKRLQAQLGPGGHNLNIIGNETLDGNEAYRLHYVVDTGEQSVDIVTINKDLIYYFGLYAVSPENFKDDNRKTELEEDFKSLGDQFFSSFKFR